MVLFIIMKEIRVSMGHTPSLKIIIIICLVSRVCTKVPLCHFQPFEGQVRCHIYLLPTHLKVRSVPRSTLCTNLSSFHFENMSGEISSSSVHSIHYDFQDYVKEQL
jgi:hypothetical protein